MLKRQVLTIIIRELFYALTIAVVILAILELFSPGIVLAYFNLNWVLLAWLIAGIITIA